MTAVKEQDGAYLVPVDEARQMLRLVYETLEMEEGYDFSIDEYESALDYLSAGSEKGAYVWILARKNRNIQRRKQDGSYENSPDTPGRGRGELAEARRLAREFPALIMLRQEGKKEQGWRGSPFWWPVLVAPAEAAPTIYAGRTVKGKH